MTMPGLLGPAFRERLAAAMRIPVVEALFREPWTAAARRVLPSPSPRMTATAMWAPIIAWCALETLAESIDAGKPEQVALDAFDRLRLRQPLAESLNALGFEGEDGWRAAARIKVVLLAETKSGLRTPEQGTATPASSVTVASKESEATPPKKAAEAQVASPAPAPSAVQVGGIARDLWSDPDVRWLTGVHDAGGNSYLVREPYEEFLWWLQMPELLRIAGKPSPSKAEVYALSNKVHETLAMAERAGYRLQTMLGQDESKPTTPDQPSASPSMVSKTLGTNQHGKSEADPHPAADSNAKDDSKTRIDTPIESKK
jgi:hypothetical protein